MVVQYLRNMRNLWETLVSTDRGRGVPVVGRKRNIWQLINSLAMMWKWKEIN